MPSLDEILGKGKQNMSLDETILSLTELIGSGEDGWLIRGHLGNSYFKRAKQKEKDHRSSRDSGSDRHIVQDIDNAIENFEASKTFGNNSSQNYGLLGECYNRRANYSENDAQKTNLLKRAVENFVKSERSGNDSQYNYSYMASCYKKLADLSIETDERLYFLTEAIANFERSKNKGNATQNNFGMLGGCYKLLSELYFQLDPIKSRKQIIEALNNAVENLEKSKDLGNNSFHNHGWLGESYKSLAKYTRGESWLRFMKKAIENLEKSKRLGNRSPNNYSLLGSCYRGLAFYNMAHGHEGIMRANLEKSIENLEISCDRGNKSGHNLSMVGSVYLALARLYKKEGGGKFLECIIKSHENLKMASDDGVPASYALRVFLWDFVRDGDITLPSGLEGIKFEWGDAIAGILGCDEQNLIHLKKYSKYGPRMYILFDENRIIKDTFLFKEYEKREDAENELLFTQMISPELDAKGIKFAKPLQIVEHKGVSYMVFKKEESEDLEISFEYLKNDEKIATIISALDNISRFQEAISGLFIKDGKIESLVGGLHFSPKKYDYFENFIQSAFVGRDEAKAKEMADLVNNGNENDFRSFFMEEGNIREYFRRLPYNDKVYPLLMSYLSFVNNIISESSIRPKVLHGDFSPSNYLADGTILDPRPLKVGNPLIDFCKFIDNLLFEQMFRVGDLETLDLIRKYFSDGEQKSLNEEYYIHKVHRSMSAIGHRWHKIEKTSEIRYIDKALGAMSSLGYIPEIAALKANFLDYIRSIPSITKRNISVSLDNIIVDLTAPRIRIAKEEFKSDLLPEHSTYETFHQSDLPPDLFLNIEESLYSDQLDKIDPIRGIKDLLERLYDEGHKIFIHSSADKRHERPIIDWLKKNKIPYHGLFITKQRTKDNFYFKRRIDIILDDSHEILKELDGDRFELYLLDSPTNRAIKEGYPITRLKSLDEFYKRVSRIQ